MSANLGTEIDKLFRIQGKLDAIQQQAQKIEEERKKIQATYDKQEAAIFSKFGKEDIEGATGKAATAEIDRKVIGTIKNPRLLYAYIQKSGRFDLLQRRIMNSVYAELSENGTKKVPGLAPFIKTRIKLKARKKPAR